MYIASICSFSGLVVPSEDLVSIVSNRIVSPSGGLASIEEVQVLARDVINTTAMAKHEEYPLDSSHDRSFRTIPKVAGRLVPKRHIGARGCPPARPQVRYFGLVLRGCVLRVQPLPKPLFHLLEDSHLGHPFTVPFAFASCAR